MEEEVLSKLIEFVEMASPQVWAMAQRQVLVMAIQDILWGVVLAIVITFMVRIARDPGQGEDERGGSTIIATVLGIISLLICNHLIALVVNPQYYAVKMMLDLVK